MKTVIVIVGDAGKAIEQKHLIEKVLGDVEITIVPMQLGPDDTVIPPVVITPEPSGPKPLTLLEPVINCANHTVLFRAEGGDGTPIEYMAPGITGYTAKPGPHRVDDGVWNEKNVTQLALFARQSGNVFGPYRVNFREICATPALIDTPVVNSAPRPTTPVETPQVALSANGSVINTGYFDQSTYEI